MGTLLSESPSERACQHHRRKRPIDLDDEMEPRLLLFKLRINQSDNLGRKDAELLYGKQSVL